MAQLVRVPARRAGDPGSNPGPGEHFSPTLLTENYVIFAYFKSF